MYMNVYLQFFSHVIFKLVFLCSAQVHGGEEFQGALGLHRGHRRQYLPRFHFSGGDDCLLLLL